MGAASGSDTGPNTGVTTGAMEFQGLPVGWREAGADAAGTPVLFAHCSLAGSGQWKKMMEALAEERPALAPDLPAHGRTAPTPEGGALQRHAAQIFIELLERRGRPCHLVGLSLGAAVLGRVAAERPDLCASVTLAEPIWFHLLRPAGEIAAAEDEERSIERVRALRAEQGLDAEVRAFMERWAEPGLYDRLKPEAQAGLARTFARLSADFDWVIDWPEGQIGLEDLAAMTVPTLVIAGELSPLPARAVAGTAAKTIPGARLHVVEGGGHMAPVSHREEVLEVLRGFWAETEAAAAG